MNTKTGSLLIKVSTCSPEFDWIRQTPNNSGIWSNCKFIFDQKVNTCDYWVVYENLVNHDSTICPQNNMILITGEPPSTNKYNKKFIKQFSTIITSHKNLDLNKKQHIILKQQSLPWMIGYNYKTSKFTKSYNELKSINFLKKEKLLSVIASNKEFTHGHKQRLIFVKVLKEYFGEKIDIYGRNINELDDKWDGIAPYKYHIALENSEYNNYFTEKISDTYLSLTYPFYHGCPNIDKYFSNKSLTKINIYEPYRSCKIIEKVIENNTYEKSLKYIKSSKDLILDRYNFFPVIAKFCQNKIAPIPGFAKTKKVTNKSVTLHPQEYSGKKIFFLNLKNKIIKLINP